jgi:endoglucanase
VQEEVGLRGAEVMARTVEPHIGFAIDTTIAYDLPSAKAYEAVTTLGKGVGVKLYDSGTIVDKRVFHYLRERCERHGIAWQPEILKRGGTDTAALQRAGRGGSLAGAISIPTRHIHTTVETVHRADVEAAIRLTVKALADLADLG